MKKRIFSIVMMLMLIITLIPATVVYANDIRVTIDGQTVVFPDQAPVVVDGRTLVPVRGVFEALGFDVEWDESTRTAIFVRHDFQLRIPVGSYSFVTNGVNHTLDVPAQLIGGRTMLPIRLPLESVGYGLVWDDSTRTVAITSPIQEVIPEPPPEVIAPFATGTFQRNAQGAGIIRFEVHNLVDRTLSSVFIRNDNNIGIVGRLWMSASVYFLHQEGAVVLTGSFFARAMGFEPLRGTYPSGVFNFTVEIDGDRLHLPFSITIP